MDVAKESRSDRCLTVPQYAKRLGVDPNKVLGWIRSGRLAALNVSNGTRPRWAIPPESIAAFEAGIVSRPPDPRQQPRRRMPTVKDYFA